MSAYLDAIKKRRSIYGLSAQSTLPDDELAGLLRQMINALPTAYNMQSTRMVLLLGGAHQKLWDIVLDTLRQKSSDAAKFQRTQQKIGSFAAGYGSILFFDDTEVTERYKAENPRYAENFDGWALQQNGMLQVSAWSLLAEQGMGASLQHYNPIIDDAVKARWNLPAGWKLLAQMPFGVPTAPAGEKDKVDPDLRFRIFK